MRISLSSGEIALGRELMDPSVAFYDARRCRNESEMIALVKEAAPSFIVWVNDQPFRDGTWCEIGMAPLTEQEKQQPLPFFKQDIISGVLTRYWTDPGDSRQHEVPATLDEADALERAAVWSAEQVEERLTDLFSGKPNRWVMQLKPKPPLG